MNKKLLGAAGFLLSVYGVFAQSLVSTSLEKRKAFLEEFTGINCASCPEGHNVAKVLEGMYPGEFVTMNIHVDAYSHPTSQDPDFRTPYSAALDKLAHCNGYPSGMINREIHKDTVLATYRENWFSATANIMNSGYSPVNIGMEALWNNSTRKLTINVELYFTSNVTDGSLLNLAILENHVIGYQKTLSGEEDKYDHVHALRDFITPMSDLTSWGTPLTGTTYMKLIKKTYTYTVNKDWNIDNCEIVAFLTKGDKKHVYTAQVVSAKDGTTAVSELSKDNTQFSIYPNPASRKLYVNSTLALNSKVDYKLIDMLGQVILSGAFNTLNNTQEIDVTGIAPGIYSLVCHSSNSDSTLKVLIEE